MLKLFLFSFLCVQLCFAQTRVGDGGELLKANFLQDARELIAFLNENEERIRAIGLTKGQMARLSELLRNDQNGRTKFEIVVEDNLYLKKDKNGNWQTKINVEAYVKLNGDSKISSLVKEVAAINSRSSQIIFLSRALWPAINGSEKNMMILHELLGLLGFDYGHEYSLKFLAFFTGSKGNNDQKPTSLSNQPKFSPPFSGLWHGRLLTVRTQMKLTEDFYDDEVDRSWEEIVHGRFKLLQYDLFRDSAMVRRQVHFEIQNPKTMELKYLQMSILPPPSSSEMELTDIEKKFWDYKFLRTFWDASGSLTPGILEGVGVGEKAFLYFFNEPENTLVWLYGLNSEKNFYLEEMGARKVLRPVITFQPDHGVLSLKAFLCDDQRCSRFYWKTGNPNMRATEFIYIVEPVE